jgi:hypothetical protein
VRKGDNYDWYAPVNEQGSGMAIGVAVADTPTGPFKDAIGKALIDDALELSNAGFRTPSDTPYTIDPTVFVDDDGQAYLHYGGFGRMMVATLGDDMISIEGTLEEVTSSARSRSTNSRSTPTARSPNSNRAAACLSSAPGPKFVPGNGSRRVSEANLVKGRGNGDVPPMMRPSCHVLVPKEERARTHFPCCTASVDSSAWSISRYALRRRHREHTLQGLGA